MRGDGGTPPRPWSHALRPSHRPTPTLRRVCSQIPHPEPGGRGAGGPRAALYSVCSLPGSPTCGRPLCPGVQEAAWSLRSALDVLGKGDVFVARLRLLRSRTLAWKV